MLNPSKSAEGEYSYRWRVLAVVSLGTVTVSFDLSILIACLPQLAGRFNTDSATIGWVNIAYYIASQSLMLTLARVGDTKGRKKVYVIGLVFYAAGLLLCTLAGSMGLFIFARALQGIGGATVFALSPALALAVFPEEERGKVIGILAGIFSIGLVTGPVLGGLILDMVGWQAVFYLRIPLPIAAILLAAIIITEQKSVCTDFRLDTGGASTLFVSLSSLLLFLTIAGKTGMTLPALFVASVGAGGSLLFVFVERRAYQPIIDLSLFRQRSFSVALINAVIQTVSASFTVFLLPFYLVDGLNASGSLVGFYMALQAIPVLLLSPPAGRLSDRIGPRFLTSFGMMTFCVAAVLFARLNANSGQSAISVAVLLGGVGMAVFTPPNNSVVIGSVPREMLGTASAIIQVVRQIGISTGMALSGSLFSRFRASAVLEASASGQSPDSVQRIASATAFHDAMMVSLALGLVGLLICFAPGNSAAKAQ